MDEARDRGVFRAADPLEASSTATTVRIMDGRVLVTDGPFAETKEQLAGYYILDCRGSGRSSCLGCKNSHRVRRRNRMHRGPAHPRISRALTCECMTITPPSKQFSGAESGRIIAGLIRVSHSFDLAEEAMQDAFAAAVVSWQAEGIPDNPAAWITAAARRKLIDYARREQTRRNNEDQLLYESLCRSSAIDEEMSRPFPDDRLSLIFTCCHPAINMQAQVALTLRTLGGLTTAEIARAFLLPEPTLAQRLVRAQRKIQQARIPYQVPDSRLLAGTPLGCSSRALSHLQRRLLRQLRR